MSVPGVKSVINELAKPAENTKCVATSLASYGVVGDSTENVRLIVAVESAIVPDGFD